MQIEVKMRRDIDKSQLARETRCGLNFIAESLTCDNLKATDIAIYLYTQ